MRSYTFRQIAIFIIPACLLLLILIIGFALEGSQQFSDLAQAFVHGHLNFLKPIGGPGQDPVYRNGKIYWSEGPFPALILMPFVAIFNLFHLFFYQGYIKWLFVIAVMLLIYKLARLLAYSKEDSLFLGFGFSLASTFIGVASVSASWYFAQVITVCLLFWCLYEYFRTKKPNWWLIGLVCGLILMTRATAFFVVVFFLLEIWRTKSTRKNKLNALIKLVLPFFACVLLLAIYNYLRFNNPFNSGFADQLLYPPSLASESLGVFSLAHLPTNLYSMLLASPEPVLRSSKTWILKFPYIKSAPNGMSIFFTSPYLLILFVQKRSSISKTVWNLLIAASLSALSLLIYFGIGRTQYGYRYSLDFLPELFMAFMILYKQNHNELSGGLRLLIIAAAVMNFYLLMPFIF
jgi:4-amino-4-deoxy-L-arabinose transferase-like glycosyltransferase